MNDDVSNIASIEFVVHPIFAFILWNVSLLLLYIQHFKTLLFIS
jgi:cytochrome c oxidase assembly factor CtaG